MDLQTLKKYEEENKVYSQRHPELPLTIFNYTDNCTWNLLWDEITLSARGLVVDDSGEVVARPFKKFFNLSEGRTNITDSYVIYEKLDGSFGQLFWYKDQWVFSSRGSFTSDQAVKGESMLPDLKGLSKNFTYCFEIIYPENKIVVSYGDFEGLILTGVFHTETGVEVSVEGFKEWFNVVRQFDKDNRLEDLQNTISDNEEGYVIRFDNGERAKVKGKEYLRLHKLMSEMSTTAVWECLKEGDSIIDLIEGIPDEMFDSIRKYEDYLLTLFNFAESTIKLEYLKYNNIEDTKEFALTIKDNEYKHFLFALRNGKDITDSIWKNIKPTYSRL